MVSKKASKAEHFFAYTLYVYLHLFLSYKSFKFVYINFMWLAKSVNDNIKTMEKLNF